MQKIVHATSNGQITIPKAWRDKAGTDYFQITVHEDELIVRPLYEQKTLRSKVEDSWKEYKNGKFVDHDQLKEKYGL